VCALSLIFNKKRRRIAATVSMADATDTRPQPVRNRPPFECIALVLQGGGALGAYQAGVFQALAEAGLEPDWISGISIGAFNSAIIAGNPPEARVEKLRLFWEAVTQPYVQWQAPFAWPGAAAEAAVSVAPRPSDFWTFASALAPALKADAARGFLNQWAAGRVLFNGTPGFFALRPVTPWFWPGSSMRATSYYDTTDLKRTLERLVDFDRINNQPMRLSVGAVNVRTGNFVYFDSTKDRIRPEHIMASGALPPAFAAVEIDGEYYWDGGLISNTPLRWVVDARPQQDTLVFQVDLWPSRGELPRNMAHVNTRQKEIMYSSRTRAASTHFTEMQSVRNAISELLKKLPAELADAPEYAVLRQFSERKVWNLIQIIYRAKDYEGDSKDYEFSRLSMVDHWRDGYDDTVRTLAHPEVLERPRTADGVSIFDIAEHKRE
jgi:NTE family protein